jgi:CheY-like chemotaxis protein
MMPRQRRLLGAQAAFGRPHREDAVVVVTAMFGLSERNYATELGAADYVTKPFELDDPRRPRAPHITPTRTCGPGRLAAAAYAVRAPASWLVQ